ncbi:MAG: QVPTGV class sortase B protein-sorting domain-containing protein, partial [Oscillospiraceae bacterium]|nr:QVPTGV class sortase B protein-sorting domain-containing protein [Oscillospiraceae bacterium]
SNNTTHAGRTVTGDYDGTNGSTTIADTLNIQLNSNIQADPGNTATITDTKIEKDVDVQFTNTRKGTIPTGVILSVAAPATIGIAVVGGIIYLVAKRKKDEDDEEE